MTNTTAPRPSAADRRADWMADVVAPIRTWHQENGHTVPAPIALVDEALARIAAEGPALGRTERWTNAMAFFAAEVEQDDTEDHRRWTLTQGSVWLAYASE